MAMTRAEASNVRATSAKRVRSPPTGTPLMRSCCLRWSSSSNATGRYGLEGLRNVALITCRPPSPAPKTSTRSAVSAEGRMRFSRMSRQV